MNKNYNQPEGSIHPQSIKTEADVFISPQANTRLITHESQNSTSITYDKKPRKPSGNYREYANNNEHKSQPPIQINKIEPAGLYSLQNSPVSLRAQLRNGEDALIRERYHNALNQSNSFHKQISYFTEFTSQNKGRMAEYRTDKSPMNGHSRYISRPIFLTTANSKNKLFETATQDHSELLEVTRQTFSKSFRPANTQSRFINEDSLATNANTNDTKNEAKPDNKNPLLPNLTKSKTSRRNLSHIFTTEGNNTPIVVSPTTTQTKLKLKSRSPGLNDTNLTKTTNNFFTHTSFASKNLKNTLSVFDKPIQARPTRKEAVLAKLRNNQDLKDVSKYHTKDMAEVLMEELTEHSKIGPEEYLEHDKNVDNFRDATMTANIKKQEMKFTRDHSGSPKPYFEIRKKEDYRESGALEDIEQFEENLRGWMKSVPNFGKQRWTYVKDWDYKLA